MKKQLLTTLGLVVVATMAWSQDAVAVWQTNGQVVGYQFTDKPKVTYVGDCLVMSTKDNTVQYALRSLRKMAFVDAESLSAISGPRQAAGGNLLFSFRQGSIAVANAEASAKVLLYDAEGKCLAEQQADADGRCVLSTESLSRGVYVIQIGQTSYKIVK